MVNNNQQDTQKMSDDAVLIDIVNKLNYYKDQESKTYVDIKGANGKVYFVETESPQFERYINWAFTKRESSFPATSKIRSAMTYATSLAEERGTFVEVGLRFHSLETAIYIDLGNDSGQVIQITAEGWGISPSAPMKFIRKDNQLPLPIPDPNGDVRLILNYINIPPGPDQLLFLAALCTLPITHIIRPIIAMLGPEGSAKTTAARLTRAVWDPFSGTSNNTRWSTDDLAVAFYSNAIPLFDNLNVLKKAASDNFCTAITGGGITKRSHYTNAGQFHISYQRPIIFTSLDMPSKESDFLDRCLTFNLERIQKHERKELTEIMKGFQQDLPKILGGCLNTLSLAVRILPSINLPIKPRLADFAKYGAAIAMALGYDQETFLEAFVNNIEGNKQNVLLAEQPLAVALLQYFHQHGEVNGLTRDLWNNLAQLCPYPNGEGAGWPRSPVGFGKMLRQSSLTGILNDNGLKIEFKTIQGYSHLRIYKPDQVIQSQAGNTPQPCKYVTSGDQDNGTVSEENVSNPPATKPGPEPGPVNKTHQQQKYNPFRDSIDPDENAD